VPNKTQVGDHGIDGRIYPISSLPRKSGEAVGELAFMDVWYPIQVKQKDKVGRPDIDAFEAVMTREKRTKGFFVAFDYSSDALTEIDAFFRRSGTSVIALAVKGISGRADCEEVGVNSLKERLKKAGSQSVTSCNRLKLPAADDKS